MLRFENEDLKRIKEGNTEPLKKAFNDCFKICLTKLTKNGNCSREDAEDVLMDSFLVLRDKIIDGSFANDNVTAYLLTIAKNRYRNKIKKDRRLVNYDPAIWEAIITNENQSSPDGINEKRIKLILNGLKIIKDPCRTLLYKNLVDGWPLKNLVEELNYSNYDVIKTSKARCMKKLKAIINNFQENG